MVARSAAGIHSLHQVAPASASERINARSCSQSLLRRRPPTAISNGASLVRRPITAVRSAVTSPAVMSCQEPSLGCLYRQAPSQRAARLVGPGLGQIPPTQMGMRGDWTGTGRQAYHRQPGAETWRRSYDSQRFSRRGLLLLLDQGQPSDLSSFILTEANLGVESLGDKDICGIGV
jgi:hypothetical protein